MDIKAQIELITKTLELVQLPPKIRLELEAWLKELRAQNVCNQTKDR